MDLAISGLGSIVEAQTDRRRDAAWLRAQSVRRAGVLNASGVGQGAHVIIAHGNSADFFADLFAVWRVGAVAVCVNPAAAAAELHNIAEFVSARAVVVGVDSTQALSGLDVPLFDLAGGSYRTSPPGRAGSAVDDPALMLFTSGTTGEPKAVVLSHRALLARTALNAQVVGHEALAVSMCVLPTHFGHGLIGNCLTPLLAGGTLVLAGAGSARELAASALAIDELGITFMSSVPALWRVLTRVARPPVGQSLRRVHVGSAPLSAQLWRAIIDWTGTGNVVNAYGLTETANWVAGASARDHEPEDGLIGRAWGGSLAILDGGQIRAQGSGELVVQCPSIMSGYYRRSDLTDDVVHDGWYRTGDIGHVDAAGVARLRGRSKSEINRAGMKIIPEEIDLLLERHCAVVEACVFGIPDPVSGERVAAAVCLRPDRKITGEELFDWCCGQVRREAVPERWFFVVEIPRSDRGKVNRGLVRARCLEEAASAVDRGAGR